MTFKEHLPKDLVNYIKAAEYLGISDTRIAQLSREGKIAYYTTEKGRRYSIAELDDWIRGNSKLKNHLRCSFQSVSAQYNPKSPNFQSTISNTGL